MNTRQRCQAATAQLAPLDAHLYPLTCQQYVFDNPKALWFAVIDTVSKTPTNNLNKAYDEAYSEACSFEAFDQAQTQFSDTLQSNSIYQQWINFTVFGRYIQRSFAAFYKQSEDVFNKELPELLKHELMRHAQRLPKQQCLFFGGKLPLHTRQEKLLISTLSPFTAYQNALFAKNQQTIILNYLQIMSDEVLGFAVKHNAYTSERLRHEVMILDFVSLRLEREEVLELDSAVQTAPLAKKLLLRYYTVK